MSKKNVMDIVCVKVASEKSFYFCVLNDDKRKKIWYSEARRKDHPSKSIFFCCPDHFDLKDHMVYLIRFS